MLQPEKYVTIVQSATTLPAKTRKRRKEEIMNTDAGKNHKKTKAPMAAKTQEQTELSRADRISRKYGKTYHMPPEVTDDWVKTD